jgi:hypothetical protein
MKAIKFEYLNFLEFSYSKKIEQKNIWPKELRSIIKINKKYFNSTVLPQFDGPVYSSLFLTQIKF